jgi:adenylate cyclase
MAFLRIISPEGSERTVELEPRNTLGSHPANSIQILDRLVSKDHCHIDLVEGRLMLEDMGSLKGTYVNGERVRGQRPLDTGDELMLGSTRVLIGGVEPDEAGDTDASEDSVGRVTMSPGAVESRVRAKLASQEEQNFVAERLIDDVAVVRRDYEKLRVSFELTRAIAGELDVDRLLEKILESAFALIAADRGVVLLLEDGRLEPRCVRTKHGDPSEEVALSTTIINEALRDRSAVLSSDALTDRRFEGARSIIMQSIRSSMAVPLIYADETLGVLVLDSQVATNAFADKDLQLAQALANQAAVAIQNGLYARKIEQEAVTRQRFERLLSPAIAELVVRGEVEVEKGGLSRNTSVFFSDIRGFTAMSERRSAQQIVDMLNQYFELMVEVVFKYEGTLDKFMGDEIMALFGAPVSHPDDAIRAVKVAVEQMAALGEWNQARVAAGEEPVQIGIGIDSGEVVAGYLGSSRALEYTVIGDVVNKASRLCDTAKAGEILISSSTHSAVKDEFRTERLPPVRVKNITQPLEVYRVLAAR